MALTFQGISKTDIETGIISKIEIAIQGGSYLNVGDFTPPSITVTPLSVPSDPAGTEKVYALRFEFSFEIVQTKKTAELAALAGTANTGLYETDVEVKFTYATGRTLTLGAVTAYPMRVVPSYDIGTEDGSQKIPITGRTIEPITVLAAKVG